MDVGLLHIWATQEMKQKPAAIPPLPTQITPSGVVWAEERCGWLYGRPNGEGAKLRGQGPRAEAAAARGLPAFEGRDAGRVTPSRWRCSRRLGRRTEAGPRRLLRRVRRPALADGESLNSSLL
jgi:hypothetical protein